MPKKVAPEPSHESAPEARPALSWTLGVLILSPLLLAHARAARLGFYHDDWWNLDVVRRGGWTLGGAVRAFARTNWFWTRPMQILQMPAFYLASYHHPAAADLLLALLESAEAVLLFLLLERILRQRWLALFAAVLAVLFPIRFTTQYWLSNAPQLIAQDLVLAAMILHLSHLRRPRRSRLLAGQALYLLAMLWYDSVMFLPLLLAGPLYQEAVDGGRTPREGICNALKSLLPYLATLVAALAWQWILLPRLGIPNPKTVLLHPSVSHLLVGFAAGGLNISTRVFTSWWHCLKNAPAQSAAVSLLQMLFAIAAALLLAPRGDTTHPPSDRSPLLLFWAAAGVFVASYLPFALSGTYTPTVYGIMNRTNGSGAWAGGFLVAGILGWMFARERPGRTAALLLTALWLFLVISFQWRKQGDWARSWAIQEKILADVGESARNLPPSSIVALSRAPALYHEEIVFDARWDFDSAVRVITNRSDLKGIVLSATPLIDEGVGYRDRETGVLYPKNRLYVYDFGRRTVSPLKGSLPRF